MLRLKDSFSKLNTWSIVEQHFETLYDYRTGARAWSELAVFTGIPVLFAIAATALKSNFDTNVLNGMLAAFSIFAGLLLNLLMLAWGFVVDPRFNGSDPAAQTKRRFLREIYQNLSFAILVSIAVVVLSLIGLFFARGQNGTPPVLTFLLHIFLVNFVLTLLMVLKRIHRLLGEEFKRPTLRKTA